MCGTRSEHGLAEPDIEAAGGEDRCLLLGWCSASQYLAQVAQQDGRSDLSANKREKPVLCIGIGSRFQLRTEETG